MTRHTRDIRATRRAVVGGAAGVVIIAAGMGRAAAQEPSPASSPEALGDPVEAAAGFSRRWVGEFDVVVLLDGLLTFPNEIFALSGGQIVAIDAPPDELADTLREIGYASWADAPEEPVTLPTTPILVDTGDHRVLIDAGFGVAGAASGAGLMTASLAAAGYAPEDIDAIFFTHAPFDHIGGAVDAAGGLVFPNARHLMGRTEQAFWNDEAWLAEAIPDEATRGLLLPLPGIFFPAVADRLELLDDTEGIEIVPGLTILPTPGETPGHTAVLVESGGERFYALGDAISHPVHLAHPEWHSPVNTIRGQTTATRRWLFPRLAEEGALAAAYHVAFPGLGRVAADGGAVRWETAS